MPQLVVRVLPSPPFPPLRTNQARRLLLPGLLVALVAWSLPLGAATTDYWHGASYDASVPTFESVLGHTPGERIVSHAELLRYLGALAEARPEQMKLWTYAQSWEGRDLVYAAIGSADTISRLDEIKDGMQRLAEPRTTSDDEAEQLIGDLPATVWLGYGVHGNEISSPDAALLTAYHLLASQGDEIVDGILEDALVLIDPLQNPDGRDRFVQAFRQSEGIVPDPDRITAEHDEPWPGGRTNHYLFDLNRDWFALTQPETRGRVQVLQEWYPLVFVDLHEMGGDSTYYFAPEAVPYNPHLASGQRASLELFGRNNAKWFDEYGFEYFTREIYDAFYPGYGASWPAYYGAVAMTYEQASPRGLVLERTDGDLLHFSDAVRHHFVASVSTAETTARNRERLLRDFREYRESAIAEGRSGDVREIVLVAGSDHSAADKLAALLVAQGVEVGRTRETKRACSQQVPAGSYVVDLAQPAKRFIRNMLDRQVSMDDEFLVEQERRRARNLPDQIYDVTAWSLPLQFGVDAVTCSSPSGLATDVVTDEWPRPGVVSGEDARVAYLVPWGTSAAGRLLASALRQDLVALSPDRPFVQNGRTYPAGTLVFKVEDNPDDLADRLRALAASTGAEVVGTNTSWVSAGVNWGSRQAVKLRPPRIAIAWDSPIASYSAGATRYVLERQFGYPVSVIRARTLAQSDLRRYQVLILPGSRGSLSSVFGESGARNLKEWVREGGTLIAWESALGYLASESVGLLSTERESLEVEGVEGPPGALLRSEEDYQQAIQPDEPSPDNVAGVLITARTDQEHWLAAGVAEELNVLYSGRSIYKPLKLDAGVNVATFAGADELLQSGYLWEENRQQLAYKPYVMLQSHGRGQVIALTADPTVRAYLDGLNVLLLNAVFRAPAHAQPLTWD